jgi:flagellar biosynthesis/type III secretory pathway protein FliH
LPDHYITVIKKIVQDNTNWQKRYAIEMGEKWKYRIMWELRSIESEINSEGGCIIITENGKIETKDFTAELSERIKTLLKSIK